MAVIVYETFRSGSHSGETVELNYQVDGTADELEAKAALLLLTPAYYGNLVRQLPNLERLGETLWQASVPFGKKKDPETGDSSYAFDTTGGTQHITQSLQTVGRYAPQGEEAGDYKGAIGRAGDNVEGVDVDLPIYKWTETHYLPVAAVTEAYKGLLYYLTGKVNLVPFRGKAAGEAKFLGASGSQRGEEDWEITFHFAASANAYGLQIGDIIVDEKRGWDYLWVLYEDVPDPGPPKTLVKRPKAAYVEQVSDYELFSQLGI